MTGLFSGPEYNLHLIAGTFSERNVSELLQPKGRDKQSDCTALGTHFVPNLSHMVTHGFYWA